MTRAATRAASLCPALRRAALASGWCLPPGPVELSRLVAALDTLLGDTDDREAQRARPGRCIHLLSLHSGDTRHLTLVLPGQDEPRQGRISLFSPLGAALLGRACRRPHRSTGIRLARACLRVVRVAPLSGDTALKH